MKIIIDYSTSCNLFPSPIIKEEHGFIYRVLHEYLKQNAYEQLPLPDQDGHTYGNVEQRSDDVEHTYGNIQPITEQQEPVNTTTGMTGAQRRRSNERASEMVYEIVQI